MMVTGATVSAPRAAHMTGLSYRQLDHWARTGFILPSVRAEGQGTRRAYNELDVFKLTVAKALLDAGVGHSLIRNVNLDAIESGTALVIEGGEAVAANRDELTWLMQTSTTPLVVLPLDAIRENVRRRFDLIHRYKG
jgi:DNA-binding transcriptional MerR regulator